MATHQQRNPMNQPIVNNGGTITLANDLVPVDVPVETITGVANGAVSGAIYSSLVSAAVTVGKGEGTKLQGIMRNITGGHLVGVICGIAAFAGLGGLTRFSKARTHNQWRQEHYDFLRNQNNGQSFVEKIEAPAVGGPVAPTR